MKQLLNRLSLGTCVWFTLLALALMLIRAIVSGIDGGIIEISRFLLLLPCGLFLSGAGLVRRQAALSGWLVLGQSMNGRELLGCVVVFAAVILAQIPLEALKKEKAVKKTA